MKRRSRSYNRSPHHRSQRRVLGTTHGYQMANVPFLFLNKWGISDHTQKRRAEVDKSTDGAVFTILTLPLAWGYWCEQWVHWLYHPINVQMNRDASGKREWFMTVNPILFAALLWADWHFALHVGWMAKLFTFFSPPIWLDGLLWLLIFAAGRFIVIACIVLILMYVTLNI